MEELIRYMRAMVMLQVHLAQVQATTAKGGGLQFKPEILLARAGFNSRDIASMLAKSQAAVAKAISRARAEGRAGDGTGGGRTDDLLLADGDTENG
jgi:hypothetical protein